MKFQLIEIFFLLFSLTSCVDKKEEWLQRYAQTKCAYQKEEERIKADSLKQIPSLIAEKKKLQDHLSSITAPFEKKVLELNEEIKETQREYMKAYRIAEGEQSVKFGHASTPEYDKKINRLENIKATKITSLQNKIAEIKLEMESKIDYKSISEKIQIQDLKIKATQEAIGTNHKLAIDSLQELLNVENSNFKRMKSELNRSEQKILELKRDSVRTNPCE